MTDNARPKKRRGEKAVLSLSGTKPLPPHFFPPSPPFPLPSICWETRVANPSSPSIFSLLFGQAQARRADDCAWTASLHSVCPPFDWRKKIDSGEWSGSFNFTKPKMRVGTHQH